MVVSYVGSFNFDESKLRFVFLFSCFGYEFDNVGKMSPFFGYPFPQTEQSMCLLKSQVDLAIQKFSEQ